MTVSTAGSPPYVCMEMNSHHQVAVSHAVAKAQPMKKPRRGLLAVRSSQASTASDSSCSHHWGSPLPGRGDGERLSDAREQREPRTGTSGTQPVRSSSATGETLNQRTAPPLVCWTTKFRPAMPVVLAPLGHVAHLVGDQAADVSKSWTPSVGASATPKDSLDALDRVSPLTRYVRSDRPKIRPSSSGCRTRPRSRRRSAPARPSIVIRPATRPELVDHDRQVVAVAAELAQQVVQALALGHEGGRPQQGPDVQLGRAMELEQVLGHQDADDVLALAFVHREARVRRCR
jgi:hypothetical protein